ncbi:MAG: hypothetical protein SH808_07440 [Saprospiraceae bacterium]|nr:hypothetical protein [Saprospiraceae bacterium]
MVTFVSVKRVKETWADNPYTLFLECVYGGLYHHFPFNRIEFKEAMIQPFVGVVIGM